MKTIELVGYGHPDRFADYISEKILVENLKQDQKAKVAAEVMVTRNIVFLGGEIYSKAKIDYKKLVYEAIEKVYGNKWWPNYQNVRIINDIKAQSPELIKIQQEEIVAADQGVIYGFYNQKRYERIIMLYQIIDSLQKKFPIAPDWKLLFNQELKELSISVCGVKAKVHPNINLFLKQQFLKYNLKINVIVNPKGEWLIGGPLSDTGLTGRKLMIDAFGAGVSHGGGAFCGKDFSKVDKTGVLIASKLAYKISQQKKVKTVLVELNYKIGDKIPKVIVRTYKKNKMFEFNYNYDLSLNDWIKEANILEVDWSEIVLKGGVIFYLKDILK
ncbi:S-adenosylmethionine synthase [Candidatus Hepatoplasma crinochetorum Av]|uniref:S-adenosylmethionine synthase n=1 Tax=Candidatus Hepatoplasma crinochetorum Av TaxID=1427984 RepID=W8GNL9_9MOLU|nr:methionine adenosyltransferase domain-containing protein [Candidatus Hepatoplasma crinochetorum]AHK22621.1 S-adenosylmethionine synthase [Candidatus Hepatoplasma crinochetorum Av]